MAEGDVAGFAKRLAQKGRQPAPGSRSTVAFAFRGIQGERRRNGVGWSGEVAGAGKRVGKRRRPQKETEAGRMEEWREKAKTKGCTEAKLKGGCGVRAIARDSDR